MNYKSIGEMGQNCVIGELSKYCIGVALVLSDNYPFEMIAIAGEKLFKIQVKTSTSNKNGEYVTFSLTSNNWLQGTTKKYSSKDCDVIILYDLVIHKCFILSSKEFENRNSFNIRYKTAKNNQQKVNWFKDYLISNKRIKEVFAFDVPDIKQNFSTFEKITKKYDLICQICEKEFKATYKNAKYCSSKCRGVAQQRVERPSKEELKNLIETTSYLQIGKKYGVSDNAIRKWVKNYGL